MFLLEKGERQYGKTKFIQKMERKDKYVAIILESVPRSSSNMALGKFSSEDLGELSTALLLSQRQAPSNQKRLCKSLVKAPNQRKGVTRNEIRKQASLFDEACKNECV